MAKVDPNFEYDAYRFIHKPIREADETKFLERYMQQPQIQFEDFIAKTKTLLDLLSPSKTPQPRYLKDIVGLTKELDNITNGISDSDLRKLITLAIPLWKKKGTDDGYLSIIRLFTGHSARVFNWFDFRMIVGEQALGEEQLGEDAWIISEPGIIASNPTGSVVLYLPFEQNYLDRSLTQNNGVLHGSASFFTSGPVTNSDYYVYLNGGYLTVPNSVEYDLSGSFTLEAFFKTTQVGSVTLFKKAYGSVEVSVSIDTGTNQISYTVTDGIVTLSEGVIASGTINDGIFHHFALIVDRTNDTSRLYLDGSDATIGLSLGALGDVSNPGEIFLGTDTHGGTTLVGGLDNFRLSLSAQYDVTGPTIAVPSASFIEYRAEELDEYFTDIRIVDEGDLDRTLTKRILNLMRPISERLRLVYIRFFENFTIGKGALTSIVPGSYLLDQDLVLPPLALEQCDAKESNLYTDIVLQVRVKINSGNSFGIRFFVQDTSNYYLLKMRSDTSVFELYRVVAGVPTLLGSISAEIFNDTFYVLTIVTDYDNTLSTTLLKCYQDSNILFELTDSTFTQGTWAIESFAGSTSTISDIEMFLMPLDIDTIVPNQVI